MSNTEPHTLSLRIGNHKLKIRCSMADRQKMQAAAEIVDREYKHMRDNKNVADGERAAIMVALRVAAGQAETMQEGSVAVDRALDECLALATSS